MIRCTQSMLGILPLIDSVRVLRELPLTFSLVMLSRDYNYTLDLVHRLGGDFLCLCITDLQSEFVYELPVHYLNYKPFEIIPDNATPMLKYLKGNPGPIFA